MIFEPIVHFVQTMHLSYVVINTISKRTQTSFHMTHVMKEYHRMCPNWFLSLWYIQHNLCTNLASRLTLSPDWPKWASTWPMSTRTTLGCTQKDFHVCGIFSTNRAPVLCRDEHYLQTNPNELSLDQRHVGVPSAPSKMTFEPITRSVQTVHLSCIDINTISKWTKTGFNMIHVT
jgi:hypothetical protein